MDIELRNQGFKVTLGPNDELPKQILNKYNVYSHRRHPVTKKRDIVQKGYVYSPTENAFYFPHGAINMVIGMLKLYKIKFTPLVGRDTTVYKVPLKFAFDLKYRDDQEDYVKALITNPIGQKLVPLHTGGGKTVIACKALELIGERFIVLVKAGYIDKWKEDLHELLGLTESDIFTFSGSDSFSSFASMPAERQKRHKAFIMSTMTLNNYLKAYDNGEGVPILPNDMLNTIQANVMLTDEVHQHFSLIAAGIIRLDPRYVIGLSATLVHKDEKKQMLYDIVFPKSSQLVYTLYTPYIKAYLVSYRFRNPKVIRSERRNIGYSQNMFEQWILASPTRKLNFFKMLSYVFEKHYLNHADKDDKALFLCNRREMATQLTAYLSSKYAIDVRRNIGNDSYEDLMNGRVVVATVGKGSTAVDIKGLSTVINLVCSDSLQFNIQAPGRLRKRPGKDLRYVQLYSPDIRQHVRYIRDIENDLEWLYVDIVKEEIDSEL